jgi:hypothetical protein
MKLNIVLVLLIFFVSSCGLREREKQLQKKTEEINQKEQQLLLKEKELELKAEELSQRERALDSTGAIVLRDTVAINPDFLGEWEVKMQCVETNCAGSAVGDTRTEVWIIEQKDNEIIAKAMSGNTLVRAYTGKFNGNLLFMESEQEDPDHKVLSRMTVRLQKVKNNELEGRREIIRVGDCKILYALDLKRNEKK